MEQKSQKRKIAILDSVSPKFSRSIIAYYKYHADSAFWAMVRQGCGFSEKLTLDGWQCKDIQQLYDVARYVEDEAHLHQRFEKLTVDDLVGTECFPW